MEQDYEEPPKSKSQIKREMHELQVLGKKLVELPDKQLGHVPISDKLREAIISAKSMKLTALKRQVKYIGGLMPDEDSEAIRSALEKLKQPHRKEVEAFHEVEQWRDRLLQGDDMLLDELVNKYENLERQRVCQLIRNAKKEQILHKPPKSARLLFKYLTDIKSL